MTAIKVLGKEQGSLQLPAGYGLVAAATRQRNGEQVEVVRYQVNEPAKAYAPHVTLVFGNDGRLLSYNRLTAPVGKLPSAASAREVAERVLVELDGNYARGLHYMRTDALTRQFVNAAGVTVEIPIRWVKFGHDNGSYNWVSVGPDDEVYEFERESNWDYFRNRRATEEWNYDQWVEARAGNAAQPPAPEALVR